MSGFIENLLVSTIAATAPLLLAALGEIVAERSGVLNLGIEGTILVGALAGIVGTKFTGSPWAGLVVGTVTATAFSVLHAFMCVTLKADQVVSGIMLTLLGSSLTAVLGAAFVGQSVNNFGAVSVPLLADIPFVGPIVFVNKPTSYLAFMLVPVVWFFLNRTNLGLEIKAVGEDPKTVDAAGISVRKRRYLAVLIGGAFAGLAGVHLSLSYLGSWSSGMSAGQGWIAIALVIFAQWSSIRLLPASLLFGLVSAFVIRVPVLDLSGLPDMVTFFFDVNLLQSYPYVITLFILVIVGIRSQSKETGAPSALLDAYIREDALE